MMRNPYHDTAKERFNKAKSGGLKGTKSAGMVGPKMKTPKGKPSGKVNMPATPGKGTGKKVNMPSKLGKGTVVKKRML
jgi:hypothetical protein